MSVNGRGGASAAARAALIELHVLSYIPGVRACRAAMSSWESKVMKAAFTGTDFCQHLWGSFLCPLQGSRPAKTASHQ